jgi:serine/threonine protein kinase
LCNMRTNIRISPLSLDIANVVESIPTIFENNSVSEILHEGRNEIRYFKELGGGLVVKKFVKITLFNRLIYSFLRKSKAERSFENACSLIDRGFLTPLPVAYIERKRWGILYDQYYICSFSSWPSLFELFSGEPHEDTKYIIDACISFIASLHKGGIVYFDLNPSNILYHVDDDGTISFELIDLNRMLFMKKQPPLSLLLKNLTRMTENDKMYSYIVYRYIYNMELRPYSTIIRCMFNKIRRNRRCRFKKEMRKLRRSGFTVH